tara:strand:+ start:528 stop:1181 length:654 start_codon:yes stop_codon:yes gene_type:complete
MPVSGVALTAVHFFVTDADGGVTGDASNIALKVVKDGSVGAVAGSVSEVDATNAPGMYSVALTAAENTGSMISLVGKTSTADTTVNPISWTNISSMAAISGSTSAADNLESALGSSVITANIKEVNGSTDGASFLALGAATMIEVTCDSGSTTSVIVGSGSISAVDDFYSERTMLFVTGDNANSARAITDYVGSTKKFTCSPAFTAAAASSDKFIIV